MEVSLEHAKVMFNKGVTVHVYDDSNTDTSFYGGDRNKPIPISWSNKEFVSWGDLENHYKIMRLNITKFDVTMHTCSLGKFK